MASGRSIHPPREWLYVQKYVTLADFTRDLKSHKIGEYAKLPAEEKRRLFGSSIVPIFVPLAPGETKEQYEKRFAAYAERMSGHTLRALKAHEDEKLERRLRMQFAMANARGEERFNPGDVESERRPDDRDACGENDSHRSNPRERRRHYDDRERSWSPVRSVSSSGSHDHRYNEQRRHENHRRTSLSPARSISSSGSHEIQRYVRNPFSGERMLREAFYVRKYVELDQYMIDYRQFKITRLARMPEHEKLEMFGSTIVPIYVPLARGESIRQYEERFVAWLGRQGYMLRDVETHVDGLHERNLRIQFANLNAKGIEKFVRNESKRDRDRPQRDVSPRPAKKVIRAEDRSSSSTTEPNRMPSLSEGKRSLGEHMKTDERLQTGAAHRDCSFTKPPEGAATSTVANAYIACGGRRCLVRGVQVLTDEVTSLGKTAGRTCHAASSESDTAHQRSVVDLTQDDDPQSPKRNSPGRFAAAITSLVTSNSIMGELAQQIAIKAATIQELDFDTSNDPVDKQLLAEYEKINQTVMAHERALGDLAAQLVNTPVTYTTETTRLQDESQSLRKLIETDTDHRSAALAMVIAHRWRHNKDDFERRRISDSAKNVLHIQRTSHAKCSSLAAEIAGAQERVKSIKLQLDAAMKVSSSANEDPDKHLTSLSRLGQSLAETEQELRDLLGQRRQHFDTLIEFDQQLRVLIKTLLARSL
jgi:hypothetical protein